MYRSNQFASQHKGKAGQSVAPVSNFSQSGYHSDINKPFQSSLASLKQTLPPPLPEQQPVLEQDRSALHNSVPAPVVDGPAAFKDEVTPLTSSIKDEQIGGLFLAMGRASQLSTFHLAQRLQTSTDIILALESGAIDLLPEWEELSQVVTAYTNFMNVDERPILRRLREKLTEHYLTSISQDHSKSQDHSNLQGKATSLLPVSDVSLKSLATTVPEPVSHLAQNKDNMHHMPPSMSGKHDFSKSKPPFKAPQTNQLGGRHQMPAGHLPPAHHMPANTMHHEIQPISAHEPVYNPPKQSKHWYQNWTKMAANVAFVLILLAGFIHWQPNRFWSGVDQLPKPIANSIYSIFELVMPDPLASTYRMNWVHVDDPRMRKTDRLSVPNVKKLPKIDFSNLGTLTTR